MPQRAVPLIAGEYYHVYNRGNNRQEIFLEHGNCVFFLHCVRRYLLGVDQTSEVFKTSDVSMDIIAYYLMPNHFHSQFTTREAFREFTEAYKPCDKQVITRLLCGED